MDQRSSGKNRGMRRSRFDRFATAVGNVTARAWFFAACVLLVVIWVPSVFVIGNVDTWQLVINTMTTIVTFLLVALLQNTQQRTENAVHQKLNAIAEGIEDILDQMAHRDPGRVDDDIDDLRRAVGLERRA